MKPVTEKQLRRRQEILSAARQLLSDAGYAGVTMRGLAKRCGVSTKLLYDVYGNKDALLASAVSERLMLVYQAIETGNREQGVDHLMMLASGIADAMLELPNFAHVYATGMASGHGTYTRDDFSLPLIRKCLIEIRKNGELPEEQNLDLLAILLRMQFRAVIMHWNVNTIADDTLHMFMQLGVCNVLKTTTTGGSKVQLLDIEIQLLKQISARHHI